MNIQELKKLRSAMSDDRKTSAYKVCTLLLGEAETEYKRTGKEPDVVAIAVKMVKSNNEVLSLKEDAVLDEENVFLNSLLPVQLTTDQLTVIIKELNATNIGEVMKYLNTNYPKQFDGKAASLLAKSLL